MVGAPQGEIDAEKLAKHRFIKMFMFKLGCKFC